MISLAIVVRDEAALLDACLTSLARAFAEVIVVDHGSKDASAEVARAHGARVLASRAESHEHARNEYLAAVKMPWVLVLDADERLASADRVHEAVRGAPADVLGFALERFDYLGRARWASTRLVRLFRRDPRGSAPVAPAILRCFLALEHFALGDDERAGNELSRAHEEDARCEPFVMLTRAQLHRARGRFAQAAECAKHSLSLPSTRFRGRTSHCGASEPMARRSANARAHLGPRRAPEHLRAPRRADRPRGARMISATVGMRLEITEGVRVVGAAVILAR